jgi:hypothetical protein
MQKIPSELLHQSGAQDGQALVWVQAEGKYLPGTVAAGGSSGWNVTATGTGSSQNITIPEAVTAISVLVFVSGIYQRPNVNYTITGTTLTLTALSGDSIVIVKPAGAQGPPGSSALWGDIGGALSTQTDLVAALATKVNDADVRGGAANLADRLSTISNFASPNTGGYVSGFYYDNSFSGAATGTLTGSAGRIDLSPFYTNVSLVVDRMGVATSTGSAGTAGKVLIYTANPTTDWPHQLVYEGPSLNFGTSGMIEDTAPNFTFLNGVHYWVGLWWSSTTSIRSIPVTSCRNIGLNGSNGTNYFTVVRNTITYNAAAGSAPTTWTFASSQLTANVTPISVRFRAV